MKAITKIILPVCFLIFSCSKQGEEPVNKSQSNVDKNGKQIAGIEFSSPAFENDSLIPVKYTCSGEDVSPPLKWKYENKSVKSYAIIVNDYDVPWGNFVHWIIFNIPAAMNELGENFSSTVSPTSGILQGRNGFLKNYYKGPCPPIGMHGYHFRLFALDTLLSLKEGASEKELIDAMNGHVLIQSEITGNFKK